MKIKGHVLRKATNH